MEVVCQTAWLRHRVEESAFVVQDGRRALLYTGASVGVSLSTTFGASTVGPICQADAWGRPWDPQPGVAYQIVLVTRATVKDTPNNSGQSWSARTEKLVVRQDTVRQETRRPDWIPRAESVAASTAVRRSQERIHGGARPVQPHLRTG